MEGQRRGKQRIPFLFGSEDTVLGSLSPESGDIPSPKEKLMAPFPEMLRNFQALIPQQLEKQKRLYFIFWSFGKVVI